MLPEVFQRTLRDGEPLAALLEVMERMHAPADGVLSELPTYFDPHRCPDEFVAPLARWVDLDRFLSHGPDRAVYAFGVGRLRELVATASSLSRWRGTARGLVAFLETATGLSGFEVDERVQDDTGRDMPFHLRVTAPGAARPHASLLVQVIESEKPVHVTYELHFGAA